VFFAMKHLGTGVLPHGACRQQKMQM